MYVGSRGLVCVCVLVCRCPCRCRGYRGEEEKNEWRKTSNIVLLLGCVRNI